MYLTGCESAGTTLSIVSGATLIYNVEYVVSPYHYNATLFIATSSTVEFNMFNNLAGGWAEQDD